MSAITTLPSFALSRRGLLRVSAAGLTIPAFPRLLSAADTPREPIDIGSVEDGKVAMPAISNVATEPAQTPSEPPLSRDKRVGFAVVGLGRLTLEEIVPAFGESKKAKLVALVSGSAEKMKAVGDAHDIKPEARYTYDQFDRIAANPDVHVVYIVLPNALHHEFTLRAAAAKKHVLCEKPMAVSSLEAHEMVTACATANVKLMIAYRCQYEKANRHLAELAATEKHGPLKLVEAVNAQNQGDPAQWRLKKALAGGGSLPDIGLYCLNTVRALTREEPIEIEARAWSTPNDPRFTEVEEAVTWLMRFPSGVQATCATHYGVHKAQTMIAHTPGASMLLENAFAYRGQRLKISRTENGKDIEETSQIRAMNQFALELDHMADCVLTGRTPRTPGEEGLQDQLLMEAIYRSAAEETSIALPPSDRPDAFRGPQLDANT